jgi:hypothetical protein
MTYVRHTWLTTGANRCICSGFWYDPASSAVELKTVHSWGRY